MGSMSCKAKRQIEHFLEDSRNPVAGEHIANCPKCLSLFVSLAQEVLLPKIPFLKERIMARIREYEKERKKKKCFEILRYTAAASVALVLWYTGAFSFVAQGSVQSTQAISDIRKSISVQRGTKEQEKIEIFDWLDENVFGRVNGEKK